MYGYSFGCSAADVWHKTDHHSMLYPGYVPSSIESECSYDPHWVIWLVWGSEQAASGRNPDPQFADHVEVVMKALGMHGIYEQVMLIV